MKISLINRVSSYGIINKSLFFLYSESSLSYGCLVSSVKRLVHILELSLSGSRASHVHAVVQGCSLRMQVQDPSHPFASHVHTRSFMSSGGAGDCVIIVGMRYPVTESLWYPYRVGSGRTCMGHITLRQMIN